MKRFVTLSFLVAGYFLNAQSIGNSPYAAFGIGDVKYNTALETSSMGGISTAYVWDFNNRFNFSNPAANTNMELANITVEGTNENNLYKSDYDGYDKAKHSTYLSNISIAFPLSKKVKFGLGYQPYSSKSYSVLTKEEISENLTQANLHSGKGTLSTVQGALSYQITPNFGLGLRTNFYFGKITDTEEVTFSNAELINGFENTNKVKVFNFTLGSIYQKKFDDDHKLSLGATYTLGNTGSMSTHYKNSTYYYLNTDTKAQETVIEQKFEKNENLIPEAFSVGAGYGLNTKWFVGSQLDYTKSRTIQFQGQPLKYDNSYRISAGGWVLPNANNFRNYFSRITYRFGAYYEKGGLYALANNATSGSNINQFAITGGVNLPYEKSNSSRMSSLDLGFEIGQRGTVKNNLISQTFFNFKVAVNFADLWFKKRLYD